MFLFIFEVRKLMYLWREQSGDMANKSEFIKILSGKNFTANILMQLEKDAGTNRIYNSYTNIRYVILNMIEIHLVDDAD